ncbi:MAG: TatD family hydrolase [Verrucomicrobiae bacterium]|nr:TatD family hydrolase [Verrucomicrobiae bacterium]NNJ86170.1 TatD family hydrolase [Akkermansiaceae bacterium]
MTDAHNHLQDKRFNGVRDQIIKEMISSGVTRCVVNGTSPDDWSDVADLARQHPDLIIPSFGLHPWKKPIQGWHEQLIDYLDSVPNSCVGECGLDRWMKDADIHLQSEIFMAQLKIATERNLPLSIHCLKAWGHLVEVLESHNLPERGFLLHSYAGSAELVPRLAQLGAYFSFSGYFLHDKKQSVRDAFQAVPVDRLLIETDAPDMSPPIATTHHPLNRGVNHPANIKAITQAASAFLNTTHVDANFNRLFGN